MAGHSKWANIKHRKARQDAKRAKVWTKVIRELTVAARLGGGDPADNPRLRVAVDNALSVNMPRDYHEPCHRARCRRASRAAMSKNWSTKATRRVAWRFSSR